MLKFSPQFLFEKYVIFSFIMVLILPLQIGPDRPIVIFPEYVRLFLILGLFLLSILLFGKKASLDKSLCNIPLGALFLLLVWAAFTSILAEQYFFDVIRRSFLAVGTSLLILLSFYLYRPSVDVVYKLAFIFLITSTLVSLIGLGMSFFGDEYIPSGGGRAYQSLRLLGINLTHEVHFARGLPRIASVTANPNTLALYAAIGCIITLLLYCSKSIGFLISSAFFVINFSALLHTFSRGAILGLVIVFLIIFMMLGVKRFLYFIFVVLFASMLVMLLSGGYIVDAVQARMGQGFHGRDIIWSAALDSILLNPFAGVGFGLEREAILFPAGIDWTMHNAYLVVVSEIGLIGFFLFFIFMFSTCAIILRKITLYVGTFHGYMLILLFSLIVFIMLRGLTATLIMRFVDVNIMLMFFIGCALFMRQQILKENVK